MTGEDVSPGDRRHGRPRAQDSGATAEATAPAARSPEEISLLELVNVLLRHCGRIVLTSATVAFLIVAVTLVLPRTYSATASFMPELGEGQAGRLAGLASQLGVSVPSGQQGQSPRFYADLLRSRALLREAVLTGYEASADSGRTDAETLRGDLVEILEVEGDTRPVAVARAIDATREILAVSTDPETGVVELSVTTRWPRLSRQLVDRLIELVNRFNLERRQSRASAERAFIEKQAARAESALHAAEDSLQRFLGQNRRYENSPELRFRYERLQRRVSLRQEVFTSLSQSLEQARVDEVRNTPVITVVDPPELPALPDPRRLPLKGALGLLLGGLVGAFWAFGREMVATGRRRDADDYAEFDRLKEQVGDDLRGLWRWLRRWVG